MIQWSWVLTMWNVNIFPHKDLYTDIYESSIHNSMKLETT